MISPSRSVRTRVADVTDLLPGLWALAAAGGLAVGAGWLGWLYAGRALRPVRQVAAAARNVDAGHLGTRARGAAAGRDSARGTDPARRRDSARGRDEVAELEEAFDAMLARLEQASEARRRFFADAVQALRAPLDRQRALIQSAGETRRLDQLRAGLLELVERQDKLVDELLTLAEAGSAVAAAVPVELADLAYRVSDGLEPEARRAGIELRVSAGPACTPGDPALLERLARSLLQNAVQYNTADGWVRVATGTDGDKVHLTVANTGPVVPTGELPALFEPFGRRTGHDAPAGLGLSIVRSVAQAHGGQVSAVPRDGGGLVVQVTLPAR